MARFTQHGPLDLQDEWVSIRDASRLLAVSTRRVKQLREAKRLVSMIYDGRRVFISRESIRKHLKNAVASAK